LANIGKHLGNNLLTKPISGSHHGSPLSSITKNPTLDKYDGTIDPNEHVDAYITQVSLYTADDALLCRVFPVRMDGFKLEGGEWFKEVFRKLLSQ